METNQIIIIAFCWFSACGLLCSFYLMCQHKRAEDREKKKIFYLKQNSIKPSEIEYKLNMPQKEEMKDEHDENQLEIVWY